jgi:xylitol oxidase
VSGPPPARTNWAGNVAFPGPLHEPRDLDGLRAALRGDGPLRVLGTGHSFNRLAVPDGAGDADGSGAQLSLLRMPPTVDPDAARGVVRVAGGVRYGELARRLHADGLALHNLGSLPHISVAGACATGTHGSGSGNGALPAAVRALDLVTASGDAVRLGRDDDRFPGAVVGLGCMGVVTALELAIEPGYEVEQTVYEGLPHEALVAHPAEVFGAGYSVSVLTRWTADRRHQVWVKRRTDRPRVDAPALSAAAPAGGPRHPVPGMPVHHCTGQLSVPGPWHERLPHFRLEFTPSAGEELQSEYLLPFGHAGHALSAVAELGPLLAPVLQISELRTVAADDLWLSPAYRQDSLAVHFTWIADGPAVARVLPVLEAALAPFGARPHWGKVFAMPAEQVRGLYPRADDAAALRRDLDPRGRLLNAVTRPLLG